MPSPSCAVTASAPEFPPAVADEANSFGKVVAEADLRRPRRTSPPDPDDAAIDPRTSAKDFDDALSVERLPNGNVRVGIHIAGRLPLREARVAPRRRGARTRQLHLPRRARSSRCSRTRCRAGCARSSKPRTASSKTVICEFTPDARLVRSEFANSVIRSVKRLTYKQAYAFLRHLTKEQIRALPAAAAPPDRLAGPPARRTHRRRTGPRPGHDRRPLEHRQGAPRRTLPRRVASTWR
jgi:ribonuclease R